MKILMIGDVVRRPGREIVARQLWKLRKELGADFVILNGENASDQNGLLPDDCADLFDNGADVITGGNHIWQQRALWTELEEREYLLRPANYPGDCPGRGVCLYDTACGRAAVINLQGVVFMEAIDCPFRTADRLLKNLPEDVKLIFVDIHAEATSEKRALAEYLDGRVTAVVGTHTHVQTNDARVLAGGTGFLTDLGMTGPVDSVLGLDKKAVLDKFLRHIPVRFAAAEGPVELQGALIEADPKTGRCLSIETLRVGGKGR